MILFNLHGLAREGDGLAPELLKLLTHRSAVACDPKVVALRSFNSAIPNAAGSRMTLPAELPETSKFR